MKKKSTSIGDAPRNAKDLKSDLVGNGTFTGEIEGIVGLHRLLIRDSSARPNEPTKFYYVYVRPSSLAKKIKKYGKDFIKDLGPVKVDPRPELKPTAVSYLV